MKHGGFSHKFKRFALLAARKYAIKKRAETLRKQCPALNTNAVRSVHV